MLFRICNLIHSFIHSFSCPKPLPKRVHRRVGSDAPHFISSILSFSLVSSSSCLRLFHRLPVTYICPSIFQSITYFRRQFLRKMWPIQLTYLHFTVYSILLSSLTVCNSYSFFTRSAQMNLSILPLHQISKPYRYIWSTFRRVQVSAPYKGILQM
jgi:hypothetical protein